MRNVIFALTIALGLIIPSLAQSQALKVAAGNTLIGTANGALIGLSVMGLQNSSDITPIRFGVGAGTLFGLGVGIYDVSRLDGLGMYYVDGLFNSSEYSALIVLLDTGYGTVTGAILGMAIGLMANENILTFMQYGASAGAIAGFTFGLVDAFYLSSTPSFHVQSESLINKPVEGLVSLNYKRNTSTTVDIGLIHPQIAGIPSFRNEAMHLSYEPTLQLMHLRIGF
ncbi:MAG: hypothetical protein JJU41_13400 [Bacteroidetes bacterium]|nr:hypothetical protein [Bacteroidota bacterium]MCH8524121.1 hypothetical protein [Balneolales bacterium]